MSTLQGQHLYLDCFSGIAGDMALGALFDLGVPQEVVREALAVLPLGHFELSVKRAMRCGISATDVRVLVVDSTHAHGHANAKAHTHADATHAHDPLHAGASHAHRHWREIRGWLGALPENVRTRAVDIFSRIARAEARIHGVAEDDVAFHEVGAVDSVVDIVGTAAALTWLAPASITVRPVPLGHGFVQAAHGRFPVPSPAALEILRDLPVEDGGIAMELTTPTGAAIVAASATAFGPAPPGRPIATGYGAGDHDPPERPNVLRAIVFEASNDAADTMQLVEANIDDMNPELGEPLFDAVLAAGARDVWLEPILMKKSRAAFKLGVLCEEDRRAAVIDAIFRESTTIGVRFWPVERKMLERHIILVKTSYGEIAVKIARQGDVVRNVAPEYESCRTAAQRCGVAVKDVYQAAIAAYRG